jgi:hypothetical protein
MLINFFVMATQSTSKYSVMVMVDPTSAVSDWANASLYLHHSEYSTYPEQIKRHLPEKAVNAVFDNSGKPGAESIGVQMAAAKELLYDIMFFDIALFRSF